MEYFANIGPLKGAYLYRDARGAAIGVMESRAPGMPIGMAMPTTWGPAGEAIWRLTVHGAEVPGLWVVVDREFRPVQ